MASYSATGDINRNTTGLRSDSGKAPYDTQRSERAQFLTQLTFPPSYRSNTAKEDLCLQFVDTFRAQFVHLYPSRPPLLIAPANEWQKQKLICTYLRPTLLPYPELYNHEACAKYIANFITYETVGDGEVFSQHVCSPTTVLHMQVGNSVEISIVLASLLLAAGYNAYVVLGAATAEVVDNYQLRQSWADALPKEVNSDDESDRPPAKVTHFSQFLKARPQLVSKFDAAVAAEAAAKRDAAAAARAASHASAADDGVTPAPPPKKCHAWVLLLPKARGISEPVFIEPSTGLLVGVSDPRYRAVDAVFNHRNYFVNMRPEEDVASLLFDLFDLTVWEHVFLSDPSMLTAGGGNSEEGTALDRARLEDATSEAGDAGDAVLDVPTSWVEPLAISRTRFEFRYPNMRKRVEYADAVVEMFADYTETDMKVLQVAVRDDLFPFMWQEHTFYKHRHDFLRRRSQYPSREKHQFRKVHQWFLPGRRRESRVEGLRELIEEPGVSRVMRFYWKAREDGLVRRTELFFDDKDQLPKKIMEEYRGRDEDRLIYRSGSFEPQKEAFSTAGMATNAMLAGGGAQQRDDFARMPIKMAEKFSRNAKLAASTDVSKRKYIKPLSAEGEIWVRFHYSDDCVTHPLRMYPKSLDRVGAGTAAAAATGGGAASASDGGATSGDAAGGTDAAGVVKARVIVMPFQTKPTEAKLREELRSLCALEKECLNELRARAEEARDIMEQRSKDLQELKPNYSVYDTLRNRPREDIERELERAEETRRSESRQDYLAPYIANLDIAKAARGDYKNIRLPAEQAKAVRDAALKDLKERLIQRGHIMQARMDREKEELNRRQVAYQKNLDSAENAKDSEEFAKFCADATWRLKILDDRLSRHIEQATEKYAQLAMRLAEDKRLAAIYEAERAQAGRS